MHHACNRAAFKKMRRPLSLGPFNRRGRANRFSCIETPPCGGLGLRAARSPADFW